APPTTPISPLPLHDALPISASALPSARRARATSSSIVSEPTSAAAGPFRRSRPTYRESVARFETYASQHPVAPHPHRGPSMLSGDRKSTRLNSSHLGISYAV